MDIHKAFILRELGISPVAKVELAAECRGSPQCGAVPERYCCFSLNDQMTWEEVVERVEEWRSGQCPHTGEWVVMHLVRRH